MARIFGARDRNLVFREQKPEHSCLPCVERMTITECPRDAMQGIPYFIPTSEKISYLLSLLRVGFPRLDAGSFVSPHAIPQMQDTAEVLNAIVSIKGSTRISVIVGNLVGGEQAIRHDAVDIIGFPWSISPAFLHQNLRTNPEKSWQTIRDLSVLARDGGKALSIYISMAFGNPYGDPWTKDLLIKAVEDLLEIGISHIVLSDTIGISNPDDIGLVFNKLITFNSSSIGAHIHSTPPLLEQRISAAWEGGCRQFDSAISGLGGCPLSGYKLVGNMNTLSLVQFCEEHSIEHGLDKEKLLESQAVASCIFRLE